MPDKLLIIIILVLILVLGLFFCNYKRKNAIRTEEKKLYLYEQYNKPEARRIITKHPTQFKYNKNLMASIDSFGVTLLKAENYYIIKWDYNIINIHNWMPENNEYHFEIDLYYRKKFFKTIPFSIKIDGLKNFACGTKSQIISKSLFEFLLKIDKIKIRVLPLCWRQYKIHGGSK